MKSLQEQYKLINEWKKENVVRKTAEIPKKDYEWFDNELKKMGTNFNKWVKDKIYEMRYEKDVDTLQ